MKYLLIALILVSWKDFSDCIPVKGKRLEISKPCLVIESESGVTLGISNACPVCMKGTITWQSGDTTQFSVPAFGPNGFAVVKVPNYPNKGKISKEWPCK